MYWQETQDDHVTIDDHSVVDVLFSLRCRAIPIDHATSLTQAIVEKAPWLTDMPRCAIQTIHVAGSQNGWQRPENYDDQACLIPSRRTKLIIRIDQHQVSKLIDTLVNQSIMLANYDLHIGAAKVRYLSQEGTLLSRFVITTHTNETDFLDWVATTLHKQGIVIRKALCGKLVHIKTNQEPLLTRSLLLAQLTKQESLQLQQQGLGPQRLMGCGVFIPHKGIEAVAGSTGSS
jgi:CRISPR-associated protein Cas6